MCVCVFVCVTADDFMMDELAHLEYETQADLDHIEELLMSLEGVTGCSKNDTSATVEHSDKAQYK